jgi:hypothetical protein
MAAGVKLGAVGSAEDRHERIVWAPVAPTMSAQAERRGLEMVGDMSDNGATFGAKSVNDFGLVCPQHVQDLRWRGAIGLKNNRDPIDPKPNACGAGRHEGLSRAHIRPLQALTVFSTD